MKTTAHTPAFASLVTIITYSLLLVATPILVLAASHSLALTGFEQVKLDPLSLPRVVVNSTTVTPATSTTPAQQTSCGMTTFNRVGSRSGEVAKLQAYLKDTVDSTLPVTGYFGMHTKATVQTFQRMHSIRATGYQGPLTTARINTLACTTATLVPAFATYGSRGNHVVAIQTILNSTGATLPVTGFYGSRTTAAVKAFQFAHGIPTTGNVFSKTLAALLEVQRTSAGMVGDVSTTDITSVNTFTDDMFNTNASSAVDIEKFPKVPVSKTSTSAGGEVAAGETVKRTGERTTDSPQDTRAPYYVLTGSLALLAYFARQHYKSKKSTA